MDDLFFFGSHNYDQAEILIIRSVVKDDELIVDVVGTLESYAWHTAYADCIQRDRFEIKWWQIYSSTYVFKH